MNGGTTINNPGMPDTLLPLLHRIKSFVFDGVMTDGSLLLTEDGHSLRTFHIRDGYAIRKALQEGYCLAVISGGRSEGIRHRLQGLGVTDLFLDAQEKEPVLRQWMADRSIEPDALAYMGDDILDLGAMAHAALRACPCDAVPEVKAIANYISPRPGGKACVIELVLKVQNRW